VATWNPGGALDLQIRAEGPQSAFVTVPLVQRKEDGAYLDGVLVFPFPGEWTLRVSVRGEFQQLPYARCGGFERPVTVRPADDDQSAASVAGIPTDPAISPVPLHSSPRAPGFGWAGGLAGTVALLAIFALIARLLAQRR